MILVVLASGRGSRLRRLTKDNPKCMIEINNNKTLLDYIARVFFLFKKIIIVTGYKKKIIVNKLKNVKNIEFVYNKNYLTTNMVESLMLAKPKIKKKDLIVIYSDILFDFSILKKLKNKKGNILPLNKNWLHAWKKRYKSIKKIKSDAENVIVAKNKIKSIGEKISKKIPKFQYMGILRIQNTTYHKMLKFYKKLKNKKISMTEFVNLIIQKKISEFYYMSTGKYWYEIDNMQDLIYVKKELNKKNCNIINK